MRNAMSFQPLAGISAGLVALRPRSSFLSVDDFCALSELRLRLCGRATPLGPILCEGAERRGRDTPVKCRAAPTASAHRGVRGPALTVSIRPTRVLGLE